MPDKPEPPEVMPAERRARLYAFLKENIPLLLIGLGMVLIGVIAALGGKGTGN